jgi:L-ascorbate metabolism protein UlaG (beta-lactamase superfamily)
MKIHFLRHATSVIELAGTTILVDPMLSRAAAMDPVANAADDRRIPLVELPMDDQTLSRQLAEIDGVLVTHTHRDHWDTRAIELLAKDMPILCQPEDVATIGAAGFAQVLPIASEILWRGMRITRTGGQHGSGEVGRKMGPVSGFVLQANGAPALYIAGDTIWCPEVEQALTLHQPDIAIVNAGAAQFLAGGPITMTAEHVAHVCRARPQMQVIAIHMEAVNHCLLTRAELRAQLSEAGLLDRVHIPDDGTLIEL